MTQVAEILNEEMVSARRIASEVGLSVPTIYHWHTESDRMFRENPGSLSDAGLQPMPHYHIGANIRFPLRKTVEWIVRYSQVLFGRGGGG